MVSFLLVDAYIKSEHADRQVSLVPTPRIYSS